MNKIFIGTHGEYKRSVIHEEIKKTLCIGTKNGDCDCDSCSLQLKYHPDFLEINSGKKDDIELVLSFHIEMPSVSETKVILINEAEHLTTSAANALLKVVEEGPGVFIFDTTKELIPTLHSRCETVSVKEMFSDNNTYGLSSLAFSYATSKEMSLINQFAENGFFDTLKAVCDLCEKIEEKKEWLYFFNLVKEKDTSEFFSTHSVSEVIATLKLLGGIFFSIAIGNGRVISNYNNIQKLYSKKEAIVLCEDINRFIAFIENKNKNDFFVLISKFC